jgi:nucleotide-binding universal stress UspA family protein
MKIKASPGQRKVVVELDDRESDFPPGVSGEIALKKILVPIDFSELSRKAVHYAVSLARQFNSEIFLLHVVEFIPTPEVIIAESEYLNVKLREESIRMMAEWKKEIDLPVRASIRDGSPFRQIADAAEEINADLIILGTQGRTGFSHFVIGSTAERVVRHAPCPVMVVREREHDFVREKKSFSAARKNPKTERKSERLTVGAWD